MWLGIFSMGNGNTQLSWLFMQIYTIELKKLTFLLCGTFALAIYNILPIKFLPTSPFQGEYLILYYGKNIQN